MAEVRVWKVEFDPELQREVRLEERAVQVVDHKNRRWAASERNRGLKARVE
jgi:hypothetical protein